MLKSSLSIISLSILSSIFANDVIAQTSEFYTSDKKILLEGKELFNTSCASCHALAEEGIGPRLGGITSLLSKKQLTEFIQNPSKIIDSGDQRAINLSRQFKLVMPPFEFLKKEEINSILAYIANESKINNIKPLQVDAHNIVTDAATERVGKPVKKSGLAIELEDFVQIPPSADKPPFTRIANMRPHPSSDGTLFVSDQRGVIYRISKGKVNTFLDIRPEIEHYINAPGLGTGLGSFAFHPDYLKNGLIYITHTEEFASKKADYEFPDSIKVAMQWVVSEWKNNDIAGTIFKGKRRELIRINVPSGVHGTQDIGFVPVKDKKDPDYGMLFIGTGDGGTTISKHPELTHHLKSLLGTIIRINPLGNNSQNGQYGIPADNPFIHLTVPGIRKEIYAYGFRNPHRMSWDMNHGRILFSAEVGEGNFEEVNVVVKGGDYGWNTREGSYGISPADLKSVFRISEQEARKYIAPYLEYDHNDGNAISGGSVYEGKLTALKDKYIFGDIVNGRIFYAHINKSLSDSTIYEINIEQNSHPTDLKELSGSKRVDLRIEYDNLAGEMYFMTKSDGRIRRIVKAGNREKK